MISIFTVHPLSLGIGVFGAWHAEFELLLHGAGSTGDWTLRFSFFSSFFCD
jgi:hypothetical protein